MKSKAKIKVTRKENSKLKKHRAPLRKAKAFFIAWTSPCHPHPISRHSAKGT
ncbi:MAG: hypothetical protein PHV80_01915 [Rugosibacter sp.]|nr:hypothetical protein [Rugosibacter sp.]